MKVVATGLNVVGKNYRNGENERGEWEMFELQVGNGEGNIATLQTTKEIFESVKTFHPYTAEIDIYMTGYRLNGIIEAVFEE